MRVGQAVLLCALAASLAAQESFEAVFRRGLVALSGNDLVQARQSLEAASRLKPAEPLVWAALAQTYWRSKEPKPAKDAAQRAETLGPASPPVQHALSLFYSEAGDIPKAAEWERRFAASGAAGPQAAARAAELSLKAGDAQDAIVWANKALQNQDTAPLHDLLGRAYIAANQPEAAVREFRRARDGDPNSETFVFDLGQAQLRTGDFPGALETLDGGRRRFPSSAQLHLAYGVAAYGRRRFSDAIDAFLQVIRIDPAIEQPYIFLARILDQAGDRLPQVVSAYAAWAKAEPRNYLAACLYAKGLAAAGEQPERVEAELRRSIRLNGGYWESHFELGALLSKRREWQPAAAELSRSIELNPKNAPAHFQLARVYDRLGEHEKAQAERAEHQRLTAAETGTGDQQAP